MKFSCSIVSPPALYAHKCNHSCNNHNGIKSNYKCIKEKNISTMHSRITSSLQFMYLVYLLQMIYNLRNASCHLVKCNHQLHVINWSTKLFFSLYLFCQQLDPTRFFSHSNRKHAFLKPRNLSFLSPLLRLIPFHSFLLQLSSLRFSDQSQSSAVGRKLSKN